VLAHAALVATLVARLRTVCGPGEHAHALVSMPREQTAQLCHAARAVSHMFGSFLMFFWVACFCINKSRRPFLFLGLLASM